MTFSKKDIYVDKLVNIETELKDRDEFEKIYLYQECSKCNEGLMVLALDSMYESYYCEKCCIEYYRKNK